MTNRRNQHKSIGLLLLRLIYDAVDGRLNSSPNMLSIRDSAIALDISKEDVDDALDWLHDEGLIDGNRADWNVLTRDGLRAIESVKQHPERDTDHFTPSAINYVNHLHFNAPVTGVQTGSHNSMTVTQTLGKSHLTELDAILQALHSAIAVLPERARNKAAPVATELDRHARSDNPSLPIVNALAASLEPMSDDCAAHAKAASEWVRVNFGPSSSR